MPKGKIITMGGSVDMSTTEPLFKEFFNMTQLVREGQPIIGIIPSASANPKQSSKIYSRLFKEMGAKTVIINPEDRKMANSQEMLNKVEGVDSFFFTGGHQLRITALMGGTELIEKIHDMFDSGAVLAGTSAGAVCMTTIMIAQDLAKRPFHHGEVEITQGLGFIEDIIIDTHFSARGRFPRLIHIVSENPGTLGIGIGEDTGAVWNFDKKEFKVIGRGNIVVIDGKHITKNNIPDLEVGETMSVSGIMVHVLGKGTKFQYEDCELYLPEKE